MLTVVFLVVQIVLFWAIFKQVNDKYASVVLYTLNILAAIVILSIINSDENPAFKLTWMLPLCLFPAFGVLVYIFIRVNPARFGMAKGLEYRIRESQRYLRENVEVTAHMEREKEPIRGLAYYIQHQNGFPIYENTEVTYYKSGEDAFPAMLAAIRGAKDFIFLEYFIINPGEVWDAVLAELKEKAKEGVEIRLMYDGFNSILTLPHGYAGKLTSMGIKTKVFAPVMPMLSSHQNYRDHRKILVVDGKTAFTGGVNLADEYMNVIDRFGYWKDTAVRLNGDAVKSFSAMFLQMWNMTEKAEVKEDYVHYLIEPKQERHENVGYVMAYNDSPSNGRDIAEEVYLDILNQARKYVYIMTPYFIPENEIITALCFAAQRGVDVRLMMPHIPDKRVVFDIAHTYYPQLIMAGVKIYEFLPGFVHAKSFVSDDNVAVVGSINLDFRSLYTHYECAAYFYKNPAILDVKKDFLQTQEECMNFGLEQCRTYPFIHRLLGRVFRIFGPLM
ncbi:MAG: cardiolipin synthase [Lachnospiraceae bacterium]|nr:cardiolipin synthase [Lachnospiraceae bacterium]